jgi:DNA-binding transcriptional ArsR family regulator
MSIGDRLPDYELDDFWVVNESQQVRAIFDPLRETLLELLLERAASVQELAAAVGRPKSSVAYHVKVLADAGLLKVVRTRIVRGREESFYGRTARLFSVGDVRVPPRSDPSFFEAAALDAEAAIADDDFRGITRYAWIDAARAAAFWGRVLDLVNEYGQLPRTSDGSSAYALLTAIYPAKHPRLAPDTASSSEELTAERQAPGVAGDASPHVGSR